LRRLRSLLKVFRPVVDSEGLRELDRKARDLGLLLGELRDADVAMDTVGAAAAQRSDDADLASLKGVLANSRAHHREKVRAELKGRQWSCLKLKLAMLPECLDQLVGGQNSKVLAKPIGRLTDKVLGKWWGKIIQAGRRIDSLSAAERHEMRKRLKTMRYAVEFLASLYPAKDVRRFTKKLRSLQDKFGYLNDVVVAEKLKLVRADGTSDPDLQRAGGYVIGWHAARAERAWNNIRSGWKRFAKSSPFWA
ncbi:MAG: CHAD domain-containing protein, partial [Terrimicrobiaceae bacterium]